MKLVFETLAAPIRKIMALRPLSRLEYAETAAAGPLDRDGASVAIRQARQMSWGRPSPACCEALS